VQHDDLRLILGPPGCGKTTRLLGIVEDELRSGARPDRVAFLSFTRRATQEAQERATSLLGLAPRELPWFRTIHSLAFRGLGCRRDDMLQEAHWRELADALRLKFSARGGDLDDDLALSDGPNVGDRLRFCDALARNRRRPLVEQLALLNDDDLRPDDQLRFSAALRRYKDETGLLDFTDLLERYLTSGFVPELDALVIDEAQDLSLLQWRVVERLARTATRVYVAGDDDQAIYRWAGADVEQFIGLNSARVEVLGQSYRLPRSVHELALGVIQRVPNRRDKPFRPRQRNGRPVEGLVRRHADLENVDLSRGSWLVLARNNYQLLRVEDLCRREGLSFESRRWSPLRSKTVRAIRAWESLRRGERVPADEARRCYELMVSGVGYDRQHRGIPLAGPAQLVSLVDLRRDHGLLTDAIWHEALGRVGAAERLYLVAALRRGESLTREPRIRVSTIHGAKGAQADNVLLMTDLSRRNQESLDEDPGDEHRVFYVGVTRAFEQLHVLEPVTSTYYDL
jgi:superfamily I DNA/RNA helicase